MYKQFSFLSKNEKVKLFPLYFSRFFTYSLLSFFSFPLDFFVRISELPNFFFWYTDIVVSGRKMAAEDKSGRMRIEAIVVCFMKLSGTEREIPLLVFGHRLMTGKKMIILRKLLCKQSTR